MLYGMRCSSHYFIYLMLLTNVCRLLKKFQSFCSRVPDTVTGPYCTELQSELATTDRLRTIYKPLDSWPDTMQGMTFSRRVATASGQGSNNWEKTWWKVCGTVQSLN
jgi:hypothetical protein